MGRSTNKLSTNYFIMISSNCSKNKLCTNYLIVVKDLMYLVLHIVFLQTV